MAQTGRGVIIRELRGAARERGGEVIGLAQTERRPIVRKSRCVVCNFGSESVIIELAQPERRVITLERRCLISNGGGGGELEAKTATRDIIASPAIPANQNRLRLSLNAESPITY